MYATKVYDYLAPYLPSQVVYVLSMVVFVLERFLLPKFYELYAHASLDPKTLLPFLISAIALYLSVVSIYHAFRASLRLVWFGVKWSIVIAIVWVVLGAANEMGNKFDGRRSQQQLFQQPVQSSWWKIESWTQSDSKTGFSFDPIQLVFGQSLVSFFDPSALFEPFLSSLHAASDSPRPPPSTFSSGTKDDPSFRKTKGSRTGAKDQDQPVVDNLRRLWVQNVKIPVQAMVREAQTHAERRWNAGSQTQNR